MGKGEQLTESELRLRISSYCSYQERSPKQVQEKLQKLTTDQTLVTRVFEWAKTENFVSESRFAETYVHGKFNLKKWGKFKIINGLRGHKIADDIISASISQIEDGEYRQAILTLGRRKVESLKKNEKNKWVKTTRYLIGKGFDVGLINELKKSILDE